MANVVDMSTGQLGQIIVGAVLKQELENGYPEASYVGKIFEIVKTAPEGTRKYSLWNITEVSVQEDAPAEKPKKGQ